MLNVFKWINFLYNVNINKLTIIELIYVIQLKNNFITNTYARKTKYFPSHMFEELLFNILSDAVLQYFEFEKQDLSVDFKNGKISC